jgi:hypothetical protein
MAAHRLILQTIIASQEYDMSKKPFVMLATILPCVACEDASGSVDPEGATPAYVERQIATVSSSDQEIFGRLAGTYAASQMLADGAKIYFTAPKPYGSWLCRVDRVHVPPWIVSGRPKTKGEFFEDDLQVTRLYAAWRSPQEKSKKDRDQACQEFQKFDDTFYSDNNGEPSRYIYLLDQLLKDITRSKSIYNLNCTDLRDASHKIEVACDPKKLLKDLSIYTSFSGSTASSKEIEGGKIHRDTIFFDRGYEDGHPFLLSIEFESFQIYGKQSSSEASIKSVAISMEAL